MLHLKKYNTEREYRTDIWSRTESAETMFETPNVSLVGNTVKYTPFPMYQKTYYRCDGLSLTGGTASDISDLIETAKTYIANGDDSVWDYINVALMTSRYGGGVGITVRVPMPDYITAIVNAYTEMDSQGETGSITNFTAGTNAETEIVYYAHVGKLKVTVDYVNRPMTAEDLCHHMFKYYTNFVSYPELVSAVVNFLTNISSADEGNTIESDPFFFPTHTKTNKAAATSFINTFSNTSHSMFTSGLTDIDTADIVGSSFVSFGGYPNTYPSTNSDAQDLPWPERVDPNTSQVTGYNIQAFEDISQHPISWSEIQEALSSANTAGVSEANKIMMMLSTWASSYGYTNSEGYRFYGDDTEMAKLNSVLSEFDEIFQKSLGPANGEYSLGNTITYPTVVSSGTMSLELDYSGIYTLQEGWSYSPTYASAQKINPWAFMLKLLRYTVLTDDDLVDIYNLFVDSARSNSSKTITIVSPGIPSAINTALFEIDEECGCSGAFNEGTVDAPSEWD